MTRMRFIVLAVLAAALTLPGVARAQTPVPIVPDVFKVDYFDNANCSDAPDAKVRITNPGTTFAGTSVGDDLTGSICAMIYVFRPDQQMAECCGCRVTHNGLLKLSVNNDLTANPLTNEPLKSGAIKIVSTLATLTPGPAGSSPQCNPADLAYEPTPAVRAWATHNQETGGWPAFAITETAFSDATLSETELAILKLNCEFIVGSAIPPGLGSGKGLCKCPPEGNH